MFEKIIVYIHILCWSILIIIITFFFNLFAFREWEKNTWLLARLLLCGGMKRHESIYCQCFYFGYYSKIIMLTIEKYVLIFIFFSRVLIVFVSLFFHKCCILWPYPILYPNMCPCPYFLTKSVTNVKFPSLLHHQPSPSF